MKLEAAIAISASDPGHAGRPGQRGGSGPGKGEAALASRVQKLLPNSPRNKITNAIIDAVKNIKEMKYLTVDIGKRDKTAVQISFSTLFNGIRPETTPGGKGYSGMAVAIHDDWIKIYEANSDPKGLGGKMAGAILSALPDGTTIAGTDWSNGFWTHMQEEYPKLEWKMWN